MKFVGLYNLGGGATGTELFTGTDPNVLTNANSRQISQRDDVFFIGQISNLSPVDVEIHLHTTFKGGSSGLHRHDLRAYESLEIRCIPLKELGVVLDGTALIHGMGVLVQPENETESAVLLANAGLVERLPDGRYYNFTTYDHTDIAAAETNTIATPSTDNALRVYKITISVQGANRVTLEWTDDDGTTDPNIIGTINFTAEGSFVYDFGDKGIPCPNGVNGVGGLLRAITSTAAVTDIDVIYTNVQNQ